MKKRNKQENVWFSQHKDGKKNVDFDFKCLKFHLKFTRKTTTNGSVPLDSRVNKSMNRSMTFMFCVLLGHFTRCCANLFQDFPFSLASICTVSFISKLNTRSILKVKGCFAKWDAILVAINKGINTNSNEASWSSQWEATQVLLHVWSYDFYEMGYFTE